MPSFLRLLALPLLAVSFGASAQANFRPGYVLPAAGGDTLRGEVDYRGAQYNAKLSRFRASAAAPVTEYQPEQLLGYGFTNAEQYQTQVLPGATSSKVFLEALALGALSLFPHVDAEGKEHYFVRKGPAALQALVQRDTTVTRFNPQTQQPTTVRERQYPFRSVLWPLLADCPATQVGVKSMELKRSALVKIITEYNVCTGSPVRYAQPTRGSKVRLAAFVLGNNSQMDVERVQGKKVTSDWTLGGGVGLDFAPAFLNPKLTMQLQLLYTQHSFIKEYLVPESQLMNGSEGRLTYDLVQNSIQIPATLRYTFPKGAVRPYFHAGPLFALYTKNTVQASLSFKNNAGAPQTDTYAIDMRSYAIGGTLGAGIAIPTQRGDVTLEARGSLTDALSHEAGRISGKQDISVIAGFTFGK
ncbi:PorT family protein [Hymenobacter sp. BT635]|uniref:PorT family protein n=1 Tax=Hymenobacter nitidus TaxID=2880929 RepID=A0ABS8ACJ9_9BACT|nr:outer membrane beta-barrel protein [Hymenobacter nitidus]MCB2378135.1 PorT family protein [Hymenobacter nitidus]